MSRRALRERERAQSQAADQESAASQGFKVRDYSPEGRGSQFSTTGAEAGGEAAPRADAPVDARSSVPEGRTLTRRELRALREAEERAKSPSPEPAQATEGRAVDAVPPELVEPVELHPWQQPGRTQQPIESQRPIDTGTPGAPPRHEPEPPRYAAPTPPSQPLIEPEPQQFTEPSVPAQPQYQPPQFEPAPPAPSQFAHPGYPAPSAADRFGPAPSAPESVSSATQLAEPPSWASEPEPAPDVRVVPPEQLAPPAPEFDLPADAPVESFARSDGHWSRQGDLDDRTQREDILPARDLSRIDAITTSALVLPSMPDYPIGPLSSTGEILVTGSMELPRMLGATGVHPARFDHADVDSIIDASDREDSHPNSSPVRAIRAVSTHTSTQGIIAAKRPRSKMPTFVLAGVATVMGAGVVVLFVGGMLLDVF